jgi:multicomponent K+:H+ antiporter subunit G
MTTAIELLVAVLLLTGAGFALIGSLGLARLGDFYRRLHGPTKATTLGVGCTLVASSVYFSTTGPGLSLHEVLVTVFLFITAPVSAHLLAKAAVAARMPARDTRGVAAPPPGDRPSG